MNAVVATLTDGPGAVPGTETATNDPAATAAAVGAPASVARLEESLIAGALQEAERSSRPVYEVLAGACGLSGERYAQALADALDYRFIPDQALAALEPDFSVLPPAEAARRSCIVVHEGQQLVAVFSDPFDEALRGWLELRVSAPVEWALAAREELANLIVRRAEALRAIDSVLPATQAAARSEEGVDNLSYVRITEDTSPVVRLVHSTVYDALRAGASDIHLESTAIGLTVRYRLDGVLQIPVNEKKGLTFARGLRSILRHDPDKIMVGEIRDPETAQIAIQSALTGHLVFTTVHANNVFDVVSRFVHMGVDTHGFVSALSAVMAQRLVRIVCEQCSEAYTPPRELLEESRVPVAVGALFKFRKGRGCGHCRGTGYHGRRAVAELMVLNDEIREAIVSRAPVRQLKELARQAGVQLIRTAALELVRRGITTVEEVNRVTVMA